MRPAWRGLVAVVLAAAAASCAPSGRPVGADPPPQQAGAAPAAALEGASWSVTGYVGADGAWRAPLAAHALTLAFDGTGVRGSAGCNSFRGGYTTDGSRLAVTPLATTRKLCREPGVMEQERDFVDAVRAATRWAVEDGRLVLRRDDTRRLVEAVRSAR